MCGMIEIFNGVEGRWLTIPSIGLPAGYSIKVFVPSGKTIDSVRNATYRAIKGDQVLYEGKNKDRAKKTIQHNKLHQARADDAESVDTAAGPKMN